MTPDRNAIVASNPMLQTAQRYGLEFKKTGGEWYAKCPFHADGKASFRINEGKQTWFCDPCAKGGSVIDFVMAKDGIGIAEAMKRLGGNDNDTKPIIVATYDYVDENGAVLYQVVRLSPKSFRQRHKNAAGEWVWTMEGVRRVPYRLPDVMAKEFVLICEGEKDCDNLAKLGFAATCNVGGAKKWLDSYSEFLRGKVVVVIPDNDPPGKEHGDMVIKSLAGKAKGVSRLEMPAPHKDVSDFISACGANAKEELLKLIEVLKPVNPVPDLPVKSMSEMEEDYIAFLNRSEERSLNLGRWLPSFNLCARGMVPGELIVVMADTGVGKTAILQNIAYHSKLPTLMFELELPGTLMFERFVQLEAKLPGDDVAMLYKRGTPPPWRMDHVFVCSESKMNPAEMERIINLSELKMGIRPAVVMVDYVGLLSAPGASRYERVSAAAEQMKVLAKSTDVVFIIASQVKRGDELDEVSLHDAKDSGSVENSAGLVLGAWREDDGSTLKIKILKNTKGRAGRIIDCNYDGEKMSITEKPRIEQ